MIHLSNFLVKSIIFLVKLHLTSRLTIHYTITFLRFFATPFLVALLFSTGLQAQVKQKSKFQDYETTIYAYLDSSWENMYQNLDSMRYFTTRAMVLAKSLKKPLVKAQVHGHFGVYYELAGDYDSSIYHHLKGVEIIESIDTAREMLINVYHNISDAYQTFENPAKALEYVEKSIEITKELGKDEELPFAFFNLSSIYNSIDSTNLAIEYLQKTINFFSFDTINLLKLSAFANLGSIFLESNELDSAKKYFDLYYGQSQNYEGLTLYDKMNVARTLMKYSFRIGELRKAKVYLDEAFDYAKQLGITDEIAINHSNYSTYFERIGLIDSAFYHYRKADELSDSINGTEIQAKIAEIEAKYETAKNENKILELENEAEVSHAQNTLLLVLVSFFGLIVIIISIFFNINRRKSKKLQEQNLIIQESYEEIENLIRESHHRIKNNLQVVSSLLKMQSKSVNSEEARTSLLEAFNRVKTIALLHQRLQGAQTFKVIQLKDFITQLTDSIRNSLTSQSSTIDIVLDIPPLEIDTDRSISFGLIINELITNSIKYAFENNKGKIVVSLAISENELKLTVTDDGKGFDDNFDLEKSKSLGFKIVKSLTLKLGGELVITNRKGAHVQINIPRKTVA